MRLAIMQPYFMPYLGYFQLLRAVDSLIILDDVNYINRGWINRNRILVNGQPTYITIPLEQASQNKKINEIRMVVDQSWREKILRSIDLSYRKAPHFSEVYSLMKTIIEQKTDNLSRFLTESIHLVSQYLGIHTQVVDSAAVFSNGYLKGQHRIIDLAKKAGATTYINAIGGKELYEKEEFLKEEIQLKFLQSQLSVYTQLSLKFVPGLSIIDVMMFNSIERMSIMLNEFELV